MPDLLPWASLPVVAGQPLTLVQLTDLHLCADPEAALLGVVTDTSFRAVLARAAADYPQAMACLLTGDLADDGSLAAYRRLKAHMAGAPWPAIWLPGNHDTPAGVAQGAGPGLASARCLRAGSWCVILLDSSEPNEVGGTLGDVEYRHLELALDDAGEAPTLVVLHHPPADCGSAWLDRQQLSDGERFWAVLARHPNVRGILCGHIHQEIDRYEHGVRWLVSPSTCVQFEPGSAHFRLARAAPGYRWLTLQADGRIETGVARLPLDAFPAHYHDTDGY